MLRVDNTLHKFSQRFAMVFERSRGSQGLTAGVVTLLRQKLILWSAAFAIAHERKGLGKLTDEELRDMGISRAQADEEMRREFFDVPGERLRMNGVLDSCSTRNPK